MASTGTVNPPSPLGAGSRPHTPVVDETHSMLPTSPRNPFSSGRSSRAAPSDEGYPSASMANRGSMVLYRLADEFGSPSSERDSILVPPRFTSPHSRGSTFSLGAASARSSMISFTDDSKYPFAMPSASVGPLNRDSTYIFKERGLVPYSWDPSMDTNLPPDDEDILHDPKTPSSVVIARFSKGGLPWRGLINAGMLVIILGALIALFVAYPVLDFLLNEEQRAAIASDVRINGTGQAPVLFQLPELIDLDTPNSAKTRKGLHDKSSVYNLVFSDEFNRDGRSFYPGDDPFWEAVDVWYGVTQDLEWYDPRQVTTHDGSLLITMDSTTTTQGGLTPGSTAPFTIEENHLLGYRSGMLQSWNKFCFTSGYIEVRVLLPGTENSAGYWPGAWTMGNLGRPGYQATTDGVWPYTYDSCDVGTFRNQTDKDGLGPAAALFSEESRSRYNNELSWLSGQRLSACSCPNTDHPGPIVDGGRYRGRGAPEIDIFEASIDKQTKVGGTISQSSQFAPFSANYANVNTTTADRELFNPDVTRWNGFLGSAVQQSVSAVSKLPSRMFQGPITTPYTPPPQENFVTVGFEYEPAPDGGYIMWSLDDAPTHFMSASSVPADSEARIGRRLITAEPLSIILNLGISSSWQDILPESLIFPAEFRVDYVRVYQKAGQENIGCSPADYPTSSYIADHAKAYQDPNVTVWEWEKPRNELWEGSC